MNSYFKCEQVLIYFIEEEIRLQQRKFMFGKSRNLILILALHSDNSLWCFLIDEFCRRVLVGHVKANVLGSKRPFSVKAGRWFWLFFFFIIILIFFSSCPPSEKSKKTTGTDRRWKYDLRWYHVLPKQISVVKDYFLWCWNKESVNHSWRSIAPDSSCLHRTCPTPAFSFLLCLSLGILILMLATNGC